jgi:hypothetical protein
MIEILPSYLDSLREIILQDIRHKIKIIILLT